MRFLVPQQSCHDTSWHITSERRTSSFRRIIAVFDRSENEKVFKNPNDYYGHRYCSRHSHSPGIRSKMGRQPQYAGCWRSLRRHVMNKTALWICIGLLFMACIIAGVFYLCHVYGYDPAPVLIPKPIGPIIPPRVTLPKWGTSLRTLCTNLSATVIMIVLTQSMWWPIINTIYGGQFQLNHNILKIFWKFVV